MYMCIYRNFENLARTPLKIKSEAFISEDMFSGYKLTTELSTTVARMRIGWHEFTCLENRLQQPTPPQNFSPEGQR